MQKLFNHPFLGRGFRPFFLLGALYSAFTLVIWSGLYSELMPLSSFFNDPIAWHAHEMIYGFTIAIIAGFLLTAVANWTGGAPARQIHLAALCLLWLAGRIAMNSTFLPNGAAIAIELSFIPALMVTLAIPLLKSMNKRNFVFLGLLSALFICNAVFLLFEQSSALIIALLIIMTMISLIGGRIIPAFTVAALRQNGNEVFQTPQMKWDIAAFVSLASLILTFTITGYDSSIFAAIAFIASIVHAVRMRHYHSLRTFNDPMLWILHVGYGWLVVGLFLLGLSALEYIPFAIALHALTAGAIGSMTLGVMCRVALGHTGRNLIAKPSTVLMFGLIQIAAAMRVLGPLALPLYTQYWIIGSSALWAICFALYAVIYAPYLWQARPDGRST